MKLYVPCLMTHWGDFIPSLWITEYIKNLDPNVQITFDPTFYEKPDRSKPSSMLEWINIPGETNFQRINKLPEASANFDKILATHHRHCHKRSMYEGCNGDDLLYFDVHGFSYLCVTQNWYPTLKPSKKMLEEFNKLNLPNKYFALHINEPLNDMRFTTSARDYIDSNLKVILKSSQGMPLVSTSYPVPGSMDLSKLSGWLKIYVLIKSHEFWGSHSGFTSIASMYRKRVRSILVNEYGPGIYNAGPPPICYTNYSVSEPGSIGQLYKNVINGKVENAKGVAYKCRSENVWSKRWHSFETLDVKDFVKSNDSYENVLHHEIENCLVPYDAKFNKCGEDKHWDFRHDEELFEITDSILDPKIFERYHA